MSVVDWWRWEVVWARRVEGAEARLLGFVFGWEFVGMTGDDDEDEDEEYYLYCFLGLRDSSMFCGFFHAA